MILYNKTNDYYIVPRFKHLIFDESYRSFEEANKNCNDGVVVKQGDSFVIVPIEQLSVDSPDKINNLSDYICWLILDCKYKLDNDKALKDFPSASECIENELIIIENLLTKELSKKEFLKKYLSVIKDRFNLLAISPGIIVYIWSGISIYCWIKFNGGDVLYWKIKS